MKAGFVAMCVMAVLAVASGRPQLNTGSANAGGLGIQGPGFQQLDLFAKVQQLHSNNNPGVFQSGNSLAFGGGTLVSGVGQSSTNIQTQALSNQNSRRVF